MFAWLESVWNLLQNPYDNTYPTLGMLLHYLCLKWRSFSMLIVSKIFLVTFFCLFTFTISLCPYWRKRWDKINDLVLSQEDKPQTYRTVREISEEKDIHRSSLSQIICKDLHLKCFKRRRAQKLTDANCVARMKRAKLLLQKFPQSATDFVLPIVG